MRLCLVCKKKTELTIFHHTSYQYDNVIEVCRKCHNKIHNKKLSSILNNLLSPIDSHVDFIKINDQEKIWKRKVIGNKKSPLLIKKGKITLSLNVIETQKDGRVIYIPSIISDNFPLGKTKCELLDDKLVIPIKNNGGEEQ